MNSWNNESLKAIITFDNDMQYEVYMGDMASNDKYIKSLSTDENESNVSGNPLGIITSNSLTLSIFDIDNKLTPTNRNSPYYGYMRNGVKIELFISYDNSLFETFGTYYVTNWATGWSGGLQDVANITAKDRIQYINNLDVPKLPAYSGIKVQELLVNLFIELDKATTNNSKGTIIKGSSTPSDSIGVNDDYFVNEENYEIYRKIDRHWVLRYHIDNRLNLDMVYGITVGSKYREALNSIAQALIARVILDRDDVIRIVPALESYGCVYELESGLLMDINSYHNSNNIYSKARVNYCQLGENCVDTILNNYGIKVSKGSNTLNGLRFNGKTLDIEDVYFESDLDIDISDIKYNGYQDGVDITFISNKDGVVNLVVEGRLINSTEASEESDVEESDTKVGNILTIKSDIIQDQQEAKRLADSISVYLKNTNKLLQFKTLLTPKVTLGDIIQVNSDNEDIKGTYKVLNSNTVFGVDYTKNITVMRISDQIVFNDDGIWRDSDDNGLWVE